MTDHTKIPGFPKIHAQLTDEHHGTVSVNGLDHRVQADGLTEVRRAVIGHVVGIAGKVHRPVKMDSTDPDGARWHLVVHPDGTVEEDQSVETAAPAKPSKTRKTEKEQTPPPAREEKAPAARTPVEERVEEPEPDVPEPPEEPENDASDVNPVYNHESRPERPTAEPERNATGHDQGPQPVPEARATPPISVPGGLEYSALQWESAINEHNQARGVNSLVRLLRRITPSNLRTEPPTAAPAPWGPYNSRNQHTPHEHH